MERFHSLGIVINIRTYKTVSDLSFINHFENEAGRSFNSSVDSRSGFRSRTRVRIRTRSGCMRVLRRTVTSYVGETKR